MGATKLSPLASYFQSFDSTEFQNPDEIFPTLSYFGETENAGNFSRKNFCTEYNANNFLTVCSFWWQVIYFLNFDKIRVASNK